jgi:hypothetical protein
MATDAQAPVPHWQYANLVEEVRRVKKTAAVAADKVQALENQGAADLVEFREMRSDIDALTSKMDKLIWAVVGLALTIAGSAIGIAITTAAHHP